MKRIPSTSWTLTPLLFGCLALIGCNGAGPDFVSRPGYTPAQDLPRFVAETAVAVRVSDDCQEKLGTRDDGREVIAQGDKGKVFLSESPAKTFERNLVDALTKAGFKVEANAPVVVDAHLRQLEVKAPEFTHWGAPGERASSLDAVGMLLPGPVRETSARTVVDVVIRKNDQRMGFSYNSESKAAASDRDRAVVDKTIGQSMTEVIDKIVRNAAADINIAAKLPVSEAEIAAYSRKYNEQIAQLNTMKQMIAEERSQLAADRADLTSVKSELERDRQNWAAERGQLQAKGVDAQKHAAALAQEEAKVKQLEAALASKQAELKKLTDASTGGNAQQEAQLKQVRGELAAAHSELKKLNDATSTRTAEQDAKIRQLQGDLASKEGQIKRLSDATTRTAEQEAQLRQLQGDLSASQAELKRLTDATTKRTAEQDAAIKRLETQLAAKEAQVQQLAAATGRTAEQEAKLKSLQDEARRQSDEVASARQGLATEQQRIADVKAQVARQQADLERRERDFGKLQENLNARVKEIEAKENATNNLNSNLGKQQSDLAKKEEALQQWDKQLKAKSEEKPPAPLVQNLRPSVAIVEPQPNITETSTPRSIVKGILMDDRAIVKKRFTVNGKEVSGKLDVQFTSGAKGFRIERVAAVPITAKSGAPAGDGATQVFEKFEFVAELQKGNNTVTIEAWDEEGQGAKEELIVNYKPGEGKVYIVAIGINKYQSVPNLKYAAADAKVLSKILQERLSVPAENVELLLDDQATLQNLKRTLGVNLKARATKQDMAIIFFSGHGAPEEDASSADQDGIEKYLLPVDADMNSFYSTALPMKEVTEIFRRLPCQRVVFIADTCYSGAVGNADGKGKTVAAPGKTFRAFTIERVVNRLGGTGRVIMTASKGSEISQEKDDLGHGVFTYFVAQGLSGKADKNRDGLVTATELYDYVSVEVARATGNNQNPLMSKDEAVGEIVLSVVK